MIIWMGRASTHQVLGIFPGSLIRGSSWVTLGLGHTDCKCRLRRDLSLQAIVDWGIPSPVQLGVLEIVEVAQTVDWVSCY